MLRFLKKFAPTIIIIVILIFSGQKITSLLNNQTDDNNEEILHGTILNVQKEERTVFDNREYLSQTLQVEITSGSIKDRIIEVDTQLTPKFNTSKYSKNEKILLGFMDGGVNNESFYVISYARTTPLIILVGIFIAISVLIARKKSVYSLLGMAMSLLILTLFILPAIVRGSNPLTTSLFGIVLMTPVLYYISHGINMKTTAAVIGTIVTLTITALISIIFVSTMHLTGITFSEVETLLYVKEGNLDLQGLLLAGILMGVLGVIDDVAITQSSVTQELYLADKKITRKELIRKSMNVGRDHIGSVINTLILVYVGGSLTTLLLFTQFPRPLIVLINSEVVLIPIVVAIVGSIGLILAVPITTILSAFLITKNYTLKKK